MNTSRPVLRFARISLVLVFVVILAGSIVRITGSGMGCPDWPKCFGYYVPPTSIDPLLFEEGKAYRKGQMVVRNDTLWVANDAFTASAAFDRKQWHKYPKHDYAIFNPLQTWIEYVNRLATAVFAVPVLLLVFFSWRHYKAQKKSAALLWSLGALFFIGFEAWLGKLVVDGNLETGSITLHMIGSLSIILCLLFALSAADSKRAPVRTTPAITKLVVVSLVLSVVQILMGTQVREEVDMVIETGAPREIWISLLPVVFKIHRSFSIIVVVVGLLLWWKSRLVWTNSLHHYFLLTLIVEVGAGIVLTYAGMPIFMQPVHLVFAVIFFTLCIYALIVTRVKKDAVRQG